VILKDSEILGSRIFGTSRSQRTKFWNLDLKINMMPDLRTLIFWPLVLASFGGPILKSCHKDLKFWKMKKFFRDKNSVSHVIAGSPRIMRSTFPQPEVLENSRSSLFSRTVNPRRNDSNSFGVELFNKTSSSIKFGTSRTGRMSRVLIYLWRTINS